MNAETQWYILYVPSRQIKKVTETLAKKKIEHYCPFNTLSKNSKGIKKDYSDPLLSNYVFVNLDAEQVRSILQINGVHNLVYWLGHPAVIPQKEILAIKNVLSMYDHVQLEKVSINVIETVEITKGTVMHKEGKVVQVKNNAVKISLPSMGYVLIAQQEQLQHRFQQVGEKFSMPSLLDINVPTNSEQRKIIS